MGHMPNLCRHIEQEHTDEGHFRCLTCGQNLTIDGPGYTLEEAIEDNKRIERERNDSA